jgi:hypothetical protein
VRSCAPSGVRAGEHSRAAASRRNRRRTNTIGGALHRGADVMHVSPGADAGERLLYGAPLSAHKHVLSSNSGGAHLVPPTPFRPSRDCSVGREREHRLSREPIRAGHRCAWGGAGVLAGATLARAEPLTTLPRSARSRVSWSLAESACQNTSPSPVSVAAARAVSPRAMSRATGGTISRPRAEWRPCHHRVRLRLKACALPVFRRR